MSKGKRKAPLRNPTPLPSPAPLFERILNQVKAHQLLHKTPPLTMPRHVPSAVPVRLLARSTQTTTKPVLNIPPPMTYQATRESYERDTIALGEALIEWGEAHPGATLGFDWPNYNSVTYFGNLDVLEAWALDEETRDMVRFLDERTGHRCTINQFRFVFEKLIGKPIQPKGVQ